MKLEEFQWSLSETPQSIDLLLKLQQILMSYLG